MSVHYKVLIGGVNVSNIALVEDLEINRRSDEAISTARVTFVQRLKPGDKFAANPIIKEWAHIQIVEDTLIQFPQFGGYIAELSPVALDNDKYRLVCSCVDYGIKFERKVSGQSFTNATDRAIAKALAVEAGIGAPDANVDSTNILDAFDARDLTVREAFERLCEITGCRWHVDTSQTLQYRFPGSRFVPFNLSDTPDYVLSYPFQMTGYNREFSGAANRLLLLGGPDPVTGAELRVTREDTASQATYGVIEGVVIDREIASASVATLLLDAELAQRATPRVSGRAVVREPAEWREIHIDHMIGVKSALYGVNGGYQVHGIRLFVDRVVGVNPATWLEAVYGVSQYGTGRYGSAVRTPRPAIACEIEFGMREADMVSTMRRLMRQPADLPQTIIGPDTEIPADSITGVIPKEQIGGVYADRIDGAIVADQIDTITAEQITGSITADQIGSVNAEDITGVITAEHIGGVAAENITGAIVADQIGSVHAASITGAIVAGQIESVSAASITGAIVADQIGSVHATAITGAIVADQIGSVHATAITGAIVAGQIESVAAASITGAIVADQIGSVHAASITGAIVADQIESVNADSITGVIAAENIGGVAAENITGAIVAGQIESITAPQITGVIVGAQLTDQILDTLRLVGPDMGVPQQIVPRGAALPALPDADYPPNALVISYAVYGTSRYGTARFGSTLFKNVAGTWAKASAAYNLTGMMRWSDIESINAHQIIGVIIASQIDSIRADQITGVISADHIGTINASSITSVNAAAITGTITADQITSVNAGSIVGDITAEQIESVSADVIEGSINVANITSLNANIITMVGLWTSFQIQSVHATSITGDITADQITSVHAASITGAIAAGQIGTVNADSIVGDISAENITVLNAGDITMVTKWVETQIGTVNASSITAGTISATVKMTSPDIEVTGTGYNLKLNNTVGLQITATGTTRTLTVTDAKMAITAVSGNYANFSENGMECFYASTAGAVCRATVSATEALLGIAFGATQSVSISCQAAVTAMTISGSGSFLALSGANAHIYASQYWFPAVTAGGTFATPINFTKYIPAYSATGVLLGKIPIFET